MSVVCAFEFGYVEVLVSAVVSSCFALGLVFLEFLACLLEFGFAWVCGFGDYPELVWLLGFCGVCGEC